MQSSLFFHLILVTLLILLIDASNFLLEFPIKSQGKKLRLECSWIGHTSWYGYCEKTNCPATTSTEEWIEIERTNGYERFVGNATTKYASLIEKFGPFSSKEEIEKFDKEALAEFGWPCVIGGKKVLCCMKPTIWDIFKEITRLLT
uniref:Uncharacterized protein n=1 Tax=Acrobeloides nanus TaxID=290746 RepID=A0A914DIE4_9BILA